MRSLQPLLALPPQPPANRPAPPHLRCRTPPEPGRYVVRSEVYPHLACAVRAVRPGEAASAPPSGPSSARASASAEPGDMAAADVEDFISFPGMRRGSSSGGAAAAGAMQSRATQTGSGMPVSRHTSTGGGPGPVLGRFQLAASQSSEEVEEASLLDSPPGAGLRRRGRAAADAAPAPGQAAATSSVLPPLGRPAATAGADGFSALSNGSGSPRSGSGSERSATSAPLYVQRRPGGMLQATHAYSLPTSRSAYGSSASGAGSEEAQPLLYSVGPPGGHGQHLGGSYRSGFAPAAAPPAQPPREEDKQAPKVQKCPRCSREYLSTINYRRCVASHLGASRGKAARGVAGARLQSGVGGSGGARG